MEKENENDFILISSDMNKEIILEQGNLPDTFLYFILENEDVEIYICGVEDDTMLKVAKDIFSSHSKLFLIRDCILEDKNKEKMSLVKFKGISKVQLKDIWG